MKSKNEFQERHLGLFKPDDSYEAILKRVKQESCSKIAEELYSAHRRSDLKDKRIAELEKALSNAQTMGDKEQLIRDLEQQSLACEWIRSNTVDLSNRNYIDINNRAKRLQSQSKALRERG
jgi:hypothetical protein